MISTNSFAQDGIAKTIKKTFNRTTTISQTINSSSSQIWKLLSNTDNYTNWNSTIVSIEGKIEKGNKINLVSTLDPKRTFKLKIKEFIPNQKLVWGDAMGKRIFTLEEINGKTRFTMSEKIGGFMFPLFANKIPSFDKSFEQFVSDLKKEAESKN